MLLIPVHTRLINKGDNLAHILNESADIQDGDIVVITSKVVTTAEGDAVDTSSLIPSAQAEEWARKSKRSPAFMEAVLQETTRLRGTVTGDCPGAMLCELRPDGLKKGTIFAPNAGMDESNIDLGKAVGWPLDPVTSARTLRDALNPKCSVLIIDSCCRPRRIGVTAFTLTACGIDPLQSEVGKQDLFGRELRVTVEAVGDQLATAAAMIMGNANQSIPAVIVRDHGFPSSDFCGWVDGIEPTEDLFQGLQFTTDVRR